MMWSFADYCRGAFGRSDRYLKHKVRLSYKRVPAFPSFADNDGYVDVGKLGVDCDLMVYGADAIDAKNALKNKIYTFRSSYCFEGETITPGSIPGRRRSKSRRCVLYWRTFVNLWPVMVIIEGKVDRTKPKW